jgi:hypothetical protein
LTDIGTHALFDDEANKAVVYGNVMTFAYTGIAEVPGTRQRMDEWLCDVLSEELNSMPAALEHLGKAASAAISGYRLAFLGAGWAIGSARQRSIPIYYTLSNFQDAEGAWTPTLQPGSRRTCSGRPEASIFDPPVRA